jgi:hypothetical protein
MTKSGGELFRMIIRLKNILKQSALAITRFFVALKNDKFLWADVPAITILVFVDYVIAPSHLERSFGYAQDDKVGWRVV